MWTNQINSYTMIVGCTIFLSYSKNNYKPIKASINIGIIDHQNFKPIKRELKMDRMVFTKILTPFLLL